MSLEKDISSKYPFKNLTNAFGWTIGKLFSGHIDNDFCLSFFLYFIQCISGFFCCGDINMSFRNNLFKKSKMDTETTASFNMQMQNERFEAFKSRNSEDGYFDVAFLVEDKILYANKCFLAPISSTFKSMFSEKWMKNDDPIKVETFKFNDFYQFLTFVYSGDCDLTDENILTMIDIAEFYQVKAFQQFCDSWLSKVEYTSDNIFLYYFKLSNYWSSLSKTQQTVKYTLKRFFLDLLELDGFTELDKHAIKIVVSQYRPFFREAYLFQMIYKWAETHVIINLNLSPETPDFQEAMKNELSEILPNIYFKTMKIDFVNSFVADRAFIFPSSEVFNEILLNHNKFNVEVIDENGKTLSGILDNQEYIADIIRRLEGIEAKSFQFGCEWKYPSDCRQGCIYNRPDGKHFDYHLNIDMTSNILYIGPATDDEFAARLIAENGFVFKGCKIRIL